MAGPQKAAGVVVSAGKMMKTVKVRMLRQEWNKHLRKYFTVPYHLLVNDPTSALREGDVISLAPHRTSKHVHHTVEKILSPFGQPLDERPALLSEGERSAVTDAKRQAKVGRRASRGILSAIREAELKGWSFPSTASEPQLGEDGSGTEHGRQIRPQDGGHEFGKIQDEAWRGSQRALHRQQKALDNEGAAEEVASRPSEQVARQSLKSIS